MDGPHAPTTVTDDALEALARQAALTARISRDRIAENLEENGDMTGAWLYRSTIF